MALLHGLWLRSLRLLSGAVLSHATAADGLHLPADIGENLREPGLSAQGSLAQPTAYFCTTGPCDMKFKNEYGRDIEINAKRILVSGPRPGPRVKITIAGPDSVDTNEVTPREAKVMAALIRRLLSGNG